MQVTIFFSFFPLFVFFFGEPYFCSFGVFFFSKFAFAESAIKYGGRCERCLRRLRSLAFLPFSCFFSFPRMNFHFRIVNRSKFNLISRKRQNEFKRILRTSALQLVSGIVCVGKLVFVRGTKTNVFF